MRFSISIVLFSVLSLPIFAAGGDAKSLCANILKEFHPDGLKALDKPEARSVALAEKHKLLELIPESGKIEESLLFTSPSLAMNAAQRHMHLVNSAGYREVLEAHGVGKVIVYDLLSKGSQFNKIRIVGHERTLDNLVGSWKLQASGSPKINVVLLVGSPGSGKSATLNIIQEAFTSATLNSQEHFLYNFKFTNLSGIKELKPFLPSENGTIIDDSIPTPFLVNPLALFPEPIQKAVLKSVSERVRKLSGYDPSPDLRMPRKVEFIRDEILKHYAKEKGKDLTPEEEVDALNNHIVLERHLAGPENLPLVNAQPKDVRMGPLFMSQHPLYGNLYGASHPFAYNYGLILNGNGFGVFLEEFLKNEPYLTRVFLTFFQDRFISIDGAPRTPWDGVIYVVTNPNDLKVVKEKDPDSPLLDRIAAHAMDLELFPDQILKILLLTERNLRAKSLADRASEFKRVDNALLDEIIPLRQWDVPAQLPDRRYALEIQDGDKKFFVMPHALTMLAYITALTRYEFDTSKAPQQWPGIEANEFRNPVVRLKAMLGRSSEVSPVTLRHMFKLSEKLNEGSFGLTSRDLDKLWPRILTEAGKSGYGRTITPQLILRCLNEMIETDKNLREKADLKKSVYIFEEMVKNNFTVPEVTKDLMSAAANSNNGLSIAYTYWEIASELMELGRNPGAQSYISLIDGQQKPRIDGRLREIAKVYQATTQRIIEPKDLAHTMRGFLDAQGSAARPEGWWKTAPRNPDLENAITQFLVNAEGKANQSLLQRFLTLAKNGGEADSEAEQIKFSSFMDVLKNDYGYNAMGAYAALELWNSQQEVKGR